MGIDIKNPQAANDSHLGLSAGILGQDLARQTPSFRSDSGRMGCLSPAGILFLQGDEDVKFRITGPTAFPGEYALLQIAGRTILR